MLCYTKKEIVVIMTTCAGKMKDSYYDHLSWKIHTVIVTFVFEKRHTYYIIWARKKKTWLV